MPSIDKTLAPWYYLFAIKMIYKFIIDDALKGMILMNENNVKEYSVELKPKSGMAMLILLIFA